MLELQAACEWLMSDNMITMFQTVNVDMRLNILQLQNGWNTLFFKSDKSQQSLKYFKIL